ncbi:MAG: hypothetical protein ABGX16_15520 [Pirellulales bacterium]
MMTKILDPRKQSDWQKRLKKFRSSGQTVNRFCQPHYSQTNKEAIRDAK